MKDVFDGASHRASDPPTAIGARQTKKVIISDCHDTLFSLPGGRRRNVELFDYLIAEKNAGSHVILASHRGRCSQVIDYMLPYHGINDLTFFNPENSPVKDGKAYVVPEDQVAQYLNSIGVEKVYALFNQRANIAFLDGFEVEHHYKSDFYLSPVKVNTLFEIERVAIQLPPAP